MEEFVWGVADSLKSVSEKTNDGELLAGRVVAATMIVCSSSMEKMS